MPSEHADRVRFDVSEDFGAGNVTIPAEALPTYQLPTAAQLANGASYFIRHHTSDQVEVGRCTFSGGQMVRVAGSVTFFDNGVSQGSGQLVTFDPGDKRIVLGKVAADEHASELKFTPAGNLAAEQVQAAIEELDAEKAALVHAHTLADVTDSGTAAAENVGTAVGDVVQLEDVGGGSPGLPAVDGSQLTGLPSAGDAAPTQVTSSATPHALADAQRLHLNVQVRSHQASVDFEVPQAASAGSAWWVFFDHASCTVSVNGDVGSVNGAAGGAVTGVEGGWAVVSVSSNAGSAPVVQVKGDTTEATESHADHDFAGKVVSGNRAGTGTASGALAGTGPGSDHGKVLRTTGNVTIPQEAGFSVTLIAGGAHTVAFGATTSAAMAAGDVMSIVVDDVPNIHAVLTAAADKVSFT